MPEKKTVFRTPWFSIESEEFDLPALKGQPIYRMNMPDSVVVVATTRNNEFILIKHFRPACNSWMLELPAGSVDSGENPVEAARRELLEETGYYCKNLEYVGSARIGADRINSRVHIVYAKDVEKDPSRKPERGVEVFVVSFGEFQSKVVTGEFQQLSALGCVLVAHWRGFVDLP